MLNAMQRLGMGLACKRDFSTHERKQLAKTGAALPDGSYPITNAEDLHHAISCVGLGGDGKEKIKTHIKSRAKALGLEDKLPDTWVKKSVGPNEFQSDPTNTDTTQEDPTVDSLNAPQAFLDILRLRPSVRLQTPTKWGSLDMTPASVQTLQTSVTGTNPERGDQSTPIIPTHVPMATMPNQDINPLTVNLLAGSFVGTSR